MTSNWTTCRIKDVLSFVVDNRGKTPPTQDDGFELLEVNAVSATEKYPQYQVVRKRVSEEIYNSWFRSGHPRVGDILVPTVGTLGAVSFVNKNDCCIAQNLIALRANPDICDCNYLYYILCNPITRKRLLNLNIGGVQPSIKVPHLMGLEIELPDIETQKKIGNMLQVIDDKIAVNQKLNDNLQQQTQAVFSAWLATHAPVADEVTLGGICLKVTDGSHFSPKDESSAKIPMLSVKDMEEFDFNLTSCKHISAEDYQKMVANDCVPQVDDILVAKDGSYLKEIFICNEQRELAILSSIAIFRPDTSKIYPEILLAFLKSPRVLQEVRDNYVSGSALPRIVLKDFKKLQFLLPNLEAQGEIAPLLASIRSQIAVNVAENQRLSQLRDALLPKLMSGELDVASIQL